jgi:hypothetical protein
VDRVQSILTLFVLGLGPEPALTLKKTHSSNQFGKKWNKWMMNPTAQSLAPTGRFRGPTSTQICHWVDNAWGGIKKIVIEKSVKKTGNANALDRRGRVKQRPYSPLVSAMATS